MATAKTAFYCREFSTIGEESIRRNEGNNTIKNKKWWHCASKATYIHVLY
jgi:hypothetical protein